MIVPRLLQCAALLLAICVALGGQVRAAELVDLDDSDTIASPASDECIATTAGETMEPPRLGETIRVFPLLIGSGRSAIIELFRPPQAS